MQRLAIPSAVLAVVDVQGKLAGLMHDREALFQSQRKIVSAAKVLQIPILWVEQNPARMGPTVPDLAELLEGLTPLSKMSFSCAGEPRFVEALKTVARPQVLLCGIETHVCIYQTAADLLCLGYSVHVPADAVSSRTADNKAIGLQNIRDVGGYITSVESAIFDLMRTAEHPAFREILKIVK